MRLILETPVALLTAIILALSLIGCLVILIRKRRPEHRQYPEESSATRKPTLSVDNRNLLVLLLFFFIFVSSLVVLVNYLSLQSVVAVSSEPQQPTATATATPTANPTQPASSPVNQFLRFDELEPIMQVTGNFFIRSWGGDSPFQIDGRPYSHGIGMVFSGTTAEISVNKENSPEQIIRSDCKEVSMEYALRKQYSSLNFSIGVDSGDQTYFGNTETHGIAEVVITDADTREVLFDTGWVNYSYAVYEVNMDLTNVNVLKITYRTCGVNNLNKLTNGLRFAIVDPILFLKDDAE